MKTEDLDEQVVWFVPEDLSEQLTKLFVEGPTIEDVFADLVPEDLDEQITRLIAEGPTLEDVLASLQS